VLHQTVQVQHDLAEDGSTLEFAVETGRIAIPLQGLGCKVTGVELSEAMIAELWKKEKGPPIEVTIGDMATTRVHGAFS